MLIPLRKLVVLAAALAALVAAYAAVGFFLVPRLVRSYAQDFVSENYGRTAEIGEVRFNPFTLVLEIEGFRFPDADGKPLASFESLLVNFELSSIWRRGASFKEIAIEQPFARALLRENGSLNLTDLAEPFPAAPEAAGEEEAEPIRLFIDLFRVNAGQASFEDRTLSPAFTARLKPITFELRDFSTTEETGNAYDLRAQVGAGQILEWSGNLSLAPLASQGRFKFSHFTTDTHWAYVRESAGLEVSSGVLGFDGSYDFHAGETATQLQVTLRELGISELTIKPAGQEEETAHLANIKVSNARLDLAKRELAVEKVAVAGGSVQVWRDASGLINLLELAGGPEAPAAEVEGGQSPTDESPWILSAPDIQVQALQVRVEDRQTTPAIELMLDPFNLRIAGFSTAPDTHVDITADARVNETGRLETELRYAMDAGSVEGRVGITAFDLTVLQPLLDQWTQVNLLSGRLSTDLAVTLGSEGELAADGNVQVDKLRTVDRPLREDFIRWDMARAENFSYDSSSRSLRIRAIKARAPYARVIIAQDETINLAEVMKPAKPVAAPARSEEAVGLQHRDYTGTAVAIDTVAITDGSMNFADFWIQPNYAVSIQNLYGTIVGLSSDPASRAKLELAGKVDRYAPANINGEVNLLSASLFTDIQMKFAGVEMTSVTPYSGRFAGYKIEKGKLTVDLSYRVENRQLKAEQKFVIDQLQLGERVESPDAISLPLRLAVALLKDRNGVIDIDLPMTGSLDDPKFRLGPLIWKAFVGLLTKIATAPFALLGKLFGGGEEMNFVEFDPGGSTLDPAGQEKMASLVKALEERPALQVDVPMTYSTELDGPLLGRQQVDRTLAALAASERSARKRVDPEADAAALADPERRFELLTAQYHAEFGAEAPLPGKALAYEAMKKKERTSENLASASDEVEAELIGRQPVPEIELQELGKARAQAIQDALLGSGQVDPGRVFLITADAKPASPAESKVRLELSLK